jgi:hypothetical protein
MPSANRAAGEFRLPKKRAGIPSLGSTSFPKRRSCRKSATPGAVELLGSLLPAQTPEELAPVEPRPSWPGKPELDGLGAEVDKIRHAIEYLTTATAEAHAEASKRFCEARRPEYAAVVARMAEAAKLLGSAIIDHRNYLREARLEGASVSFLRPVSTEQFGFVGEAGTPLLRLIDDSIEAGHVAGDSRPVWKTPSRDAWSVS